MTEIDFSILYFIQNNIKNPVFDAVMPFLSFIGSSGAVWIGICLLTLFFKNMRKISAAALLAMLLSFVAGEMILKNVFCRIRPCYIDTAVEMIIARPNGYSFPSGHTASSFSCACVFFAYNKKAGIPALVLAALISFSRLYNFVHYPSDVFAGIILGIISAIISIWIIKVVFDKINLNKYTASDDIKSADSE